MFFDLNFDPVVTVLIAVFILALLSEFLLELFSVRISLCTGRLQTLLFERVGQSLISDYLIAFCFQFFSFRKKAFFNQLAGLVNVGSFSNKQILMIVAGSSVGMGFSTLLLLPGALWLSLSLCILSFLLTLLGKEQWRDLGVGLLTLGLFQLIITYFDMFFEGIKASTLSLPMDMGWVLAVILFISLAFRTPIAFLLFMSVGHVLFAWPVILLPVCFFLYSLLSKFDFYKQFFLNRKRLYYTLKVSLIWQLIQLGLALIISSILAPQITALLQSESLLASFQGIVIYYFIYQTLTSILMTPVGFLYTLSNRMEKQSRVSQKILNDLNKNNYFSIHLSLFLLRQEFKKFITSVHTLFKMAREFENNNDELNHKFLHYENILFRVGDEIKELCFGIGRQRSYRWHVKEIMNYYKLVNQVELLVDDLHKVADLLKREDNEPEWEKDCRYWLGLQLKIFESFLSVVVGVESEPNEKLDSNIEKSYQLLDSFFVDPPSGKSARSLSQTFYRITDSLNNLARM